MSSKPSLLLYIHGFNSSSESFKAQAMKQYCATNRPDIKVVIPNLPNYPDQVAQSLTSIIDDYIQDYTIGLVGSSLGGYMSTWLNAKYGCRAVVVNPAVKPYELLVDYLGKQQNIYTKEEYWLESKHVAQLKALDIETIINPKQFWLMQQMGDEVLDYRQAVEKFSQAKQTIEEGGDHSFIGFEQYAERIVQFLEL
ncbi:esterase YqiA [Vibrio sp. RC27]